MAGEFITPQIANGGAGSPDVPGVRAPDYRQYQAAEQVRTDLPDNGAAARARALSGAFKDFEGVSTDVLNKAVVQPGAIAGAASGATGHPQYKQGLARLTAYGQAYNNAATGAYAIQAQADIDDTAARLRVQANNNPQTFYTTFSAYRDAALKHAPPEAQAMLAEEFNKRLAANYAAITNDQLTQQRQLQRSNYDEGIARQTSRVANLQGSPSEQDQLSAMDEHIKLNTMIEGGFNSGLYSRAEADSMHVIAMRTITGQVFETQFNRTLTNEGPSAAVDLLDRFQAAHTANLSDTSGQPVLSEPEFQKIYQDGVTKLRDYNLGIATNKRDGKAAEEARYEAGDQQYTAAALSGQMTMKGLADGVRSGNLKPETARAIRSIIEPGNAVAKTDVSAYARATSDPQLLDRTPLELARTPGLTISDKKKLIDEQQKRLASWENTQAVKDGDRNLQVALKIAPGTQTAGMDEDTRKAYVEAHQEYLQLLKTSDPALRDSLADSVSKTVVQRIKQREAQTQIQSLTTSKQSAIQHHGPRGDQERWEPEALQKYLKQKDDAIAALQAQAKGQ